MKTITFDEQKFKLVPIIPVTYKGELNLWHTILADISDTLPGVEEHSGKPFVYANSLQRNDIISRQQKLSSQNSGKYNIPLYDHPAPTIDALAIVKATLEAAAIEAENCTANGWVSGEIKKLDPQAILDSVKK